MEGADIVKDKQGFELIEMVCVTFILNEVLLAVHKYTVTGWRLKANVRYAL